MMFTEVVKAQNDNLNSDKLALKGICVYIFIEYICIAKLNYKS